MRGNKRFKLDLEACAAVPDGRGGETLLAFGSGSSALRERILRVDGAGGRAAARGAARGVGLLRAAARERAEFSGSELNVEGAVWREGASCLLNRGNGAPVDGRAPVDASCEIGLAGAARVPGRPRRPSAARAARTSSSMTWGRSTGAGSASRTRRRSASSLVYTATAEASPNAVDDGPVAGSALGVIGADGEARWTALRRRGRRAASTARWRAWRAAPRPGTVLVVVDRDDPACPSELCEVELEGRWAE